MHRGARALKNYLYFLPRTLLGFDKGSRWPSRRFQSRTIKKNKSDSLDQRVYPGRGEVAVATLQLAKCRSNVVSQAFSWDGRTRRSRSLTTRRSCALRISWCVRPRPPLHILYFSRRRRSSGLSPHPLSLFLSLLPPPLSPSHSCSSLAPLGHELGVRL